MVTVTQTMSKTTWLFVCVIVSLGDIVVAGALNSYPSPLPSLNLGVLAVTLDNRYLNMEAEFFMMYILVFEVSYAISVNHSTS